MKGMVQANGRDVERQMHALAHVLFHVGYAELSPRERMILCRFVREGCAELSGSEVMLLRPLAWRLARLYAQLEAQGVAGCHGRA